MAPSNINPHDFWLSFATPLKPTDSSDNKVAASANPSGRHLSTKSEAKSRKPGPRTAAVPDIAPGEYRSPHPKRIIVCCDGTWQNSVSHLENVPSNVTRLARSISRFGEGDIPQTVFYNPGVGTGDGVGVTERIRQALFGDGLVADILKAYNFIVNNYTLGDEVMCFGFSRGAYTARSVAGLITDIGIVLPSEMHDFHDLYRVYRDHDHNHSASFRESEGYQQWITGIRDPKTPLHWIQMPHRLPPDCTRLVKVVGVFDTVGALGIPGYTWPQAIVNTVARNLPVPVIDDHRFHNHSLSRYIEHAYHALALDEGGYSFTPTLWRLPDPVAHQSGVDVRQLQKDFQRALDSNANPETLSDYWAEMIRGDEARTNAGGNNEVDLRQVWFPGSHVNIGGGNAGIHVGVPYDYEQLSLISLAWMCDQIRPYLKLDDSTEPGQGDGDPETLSTLAEREMMQRLRFIAVANHQRENSNFLQRNATRVGRGIVSALRLYSWVDTVEDPAGTGWSTGPIIDALEKGFGYIPKMLRTRWLTRTPRHYNKTDHAGNAGGAGDTCEEIHPSAAYRWRQDQKYRPESLDKFERTQYPVSGGNDGRQYVWRKTIDTWSETLLGRLDITGVLHQKTLVSKELLFLRETVIRPTDTVTRGLVSYSPGGSEFVRQLMEMTG